MSLNYISLRLFSLLLLSTVVSPAQAQNPPSQRELNGFLLGQDGKAIAAGFGTLIKEQKYNDGWTDRVYANDTTQPGFMVFGFADSSDDCYSIQVSGGAGTQMRPFLGLRLGDPRDKVMSVLGAPSRVQHMQQPVLEFLQYARRNYSVELDSLGNLWSIRILGYRGFPDTPADNLPNLVQIFEALRSNDPPKILDVLAPDVEINDGDSQLSFKGPAAVEIEDPDSWMSLLLYSGRYSVASVSDADAKAASLDLTSFEKNKQAPMFRFPESSPVKDAVFVVHAGKWRIWEAHILH